MSKTIVVAIDLSKEKESKSFKKQSFVDQLGLIEKKIDMICANLSRMEADNWIISWQEYGLSNYLDDPDKHDNKDYHGDRYLSLEQRKVFKEFLRDLSQKYQKLTIIGGTIASAREIHPEAQPEKALKLKKPNGSSFFQPNTEIYMIRNTSYVANQGKVTRHDKTLEYFEESKFEPRGLGIFRPGTGNKGEKSKINETIGIEICLEHRLGVLAAEVSGKKPPSIQFILSDSTQIMPKFRVPESRYLIHIDSKEEVRMITEASEAHTQVKLYSCNIWSESSEFKLTEIQPMPMKSYIYSKILGILNNDADENPFHSVKRYITDECQLNAYDCSELISCIAEKWKDKQFGQVPFFRVKQLIEWLLDLHQAANLSLDKKTREILINSTVAANPKRPPDQFFINKITAIPLREEMEIKQENVAFSPNCS